jgi:glycosyltransferase involved in cell wall biosynthesis
LIPPEDTGGGSRPAQLGAELHRRGLAVDWRYALTIFPWPARRRPSVDRLRVRYVGEPDAPPLGDLILLEAPHPALCSLVGLASPGARVVYDAIDAWDGVLGLPWYDRGAEDWVLRRADHLVASAESLCAELRARSGRPVERLPNAVDLAIFDASTRRPAPSDLRRGSPTIGYVGALWGEWVDVALLDELARALPTAAINLIGPRGDRRLPECQNLHWLGVKLQTELPAYLACCDVLLVPFVESRLSAAVSPLKVYEYLAMERPVVATSLPELSGIPGVSLATRETFVDAVRAAASRTLDRAAVRAYVERQTWAARVDRLLQILA